ncbi:poly glycohydrolase [Ancylostoma ceylanicum]|uniref:Poly glycohydrolase n=1 Tax=Ancylostoma ceylanicum TaxID=53326 RepID=A0A0D6LZP3_9BILA|nr:poly glycohydrolase [Ancylostoma ceylanicum]
MKATNAERLDRILSQAKNCHEVELNLHNLDSNRDYCGFQVSTLNKDFPPKPSPETCADTDLNFGIPGFTKLPWSTANIENGCHLYTTIQKALENLANKGANTVDDVIKTMKTCAPWLESFGSLRRFVDNLSTSEKREALNTMAGIAKLAANAKNVITAIPLVGVTSTIAIEDAPGCLQVDFADEYIGGLVLASPIDQEEVRFLICPEMIVSSLLCEKMEPLEAIQIIGAQRYNSYSGYRGTLKWIPFKHYGSEPRDEFGRVVCDLAAIDALPFYEMHENFQYTKENIDRELNKAYAGFMSSLKEARPVATGNWGCGAFGGNKKLKSLIQMLAAAKAGRAMIYCTFNDKHFESSMIKQYEKLVGMNATIGAVYKALLSYDKERKQNPRLSVYRHVCDFMRRDTTLTGCIKSACTSTVDH